MGNTKYYIEILVIGQILFCLVFFDIIKILNS